MNYVGPYGKFISGLQLTAAFCKAAVAPVMHTHFPDVQYAAARIGPGSDVLGFDDVRSTDHFWGPLLHLFLREEDYPHWADQINRTLAAELPLEVLGFPTNFRPFDDEEAHLGHLGHLQAVASPPINHGVMLATVPRYFRAYLDVDPLQTLEPIEWLVMSEQHLLMLTAGAVFLDAPGQLTRARTALAYYPHDVWLYLLAAQWARIGQYEAFVGRAGEVGDELGSRLIYARFVHDIMHLAFLLERTYAPYAKWLGTAFQRLQCASELAPHLAGALAANDWRTRERHLVNAYEVVARLQNDLGVTERVPQTGASFHGRPFLVIHADRFARAAEQAIRHPVLRGLPPRIGSVSQWVDATDVLERPRLVQRLRSAYTSN
jgi:Domain of unknown function (DUF4037)